MQSFSFDSVDLPGTIPALRSEVRAFLVQERDQSPDRWPAERRANSWAVFDSEFSKRLAALGWVGMIWPKQYGGHERSSIERYVVLEELLAAGAPVGAHWIADRQSGPAILRFGSEAQRERYLPGMARGEIYCCIGMSEPNAGSDLASVRTRAERLPDGRWKINGQKIWTTQAQRCRLIIALVRTSPVDDKNRQAGLSQFLIELDTPGVQIRPIPDLVGDVHFNEVFFEDCIVDAECLLGTEGEGWKQVTGELSLERSGPERYMSSLALYLELLRAVGPNPSEILRQAIGRTAAELWTLRQMSISVAGQLAAGRDPSIEAAIVKDLGNSFEQALPALVQSIVDEGVRLEADSDLSRVLAFLLQTSPSFSLRGGTREILRGIIARGLGLR
jgi:alkylation response protein AidB-like acyl-CoA dehydrogenase